MAASWFLLRGIEISNVQCRDVTFQCELYQVTLQLPVSKVDTEAKGCARTHCCVCRGGRQTLCVLHALLDIVTALRSRQAWRPEAYLFGCAGLMLTARRYPRLPDAAQRRWDRLRWMSGPQTLWTGGRSTRFVLLERSFWHGLESMWQSSSSSEGGALMLSSAMFKQLRLCPSGRRVRWQTRWAIRCRMKVQRALLRGHARPATPRTSGRWSAISSASVRSRRMSWCTTPVLSLRTSQVRLRVHWIVRVG